MSDLPKVGQWWEDHEGVRVYVVGFRTGGDMVCQYECGTIGIALFNRRWARLDGCTGWNWNKPAQEKFPQWFSHNLSDRMAAGVAFIKRISREYYLCVKFDGTEERYEWTVELDQWVKSGKWTSITEEEASAKLREECCEPDPDVNMLAALVNLRDNMDRLNKRVEKLEQAASEWTKAWRIIAGALKEMRCPDCDGNARAIIARLAQQNMLIVGIDNVKD